MYLLIVLLVYHKFGQYTIHVYLLSVIAHSLTFFIHWETSSKYMTWYDILERYSNMTSFIGYVNNTVIKLPIYFNSHMSIEKQIINTILK